MDKLETAIRNRMAYANANAEMFAQNEMSESAEMWQTIAGVLWSILDEAGS